MNAGAWILCTEWTTDGGSAGAFEGVRVATNDQFHFQGADAWAHRHGAKLEFSRPGKPTDNAFIESFTGRLRQECLNQNWFLFLADARETIENWRQTATNIDHTACWANKRGANSWPVGNKPEPIKKPHF